MPPNIHDLGIELDIDYGIITSGSCSTPEAQARFDEQQMGKPPLAED